MHVVARMAPWWEGTTQLFYPTVEKGHITSQDVFFGRVGGACHCRAIVV